MIERTLKIKLLDLINKYPIVTLTGPRQSGKSTLLRASFPDYKYVSLEDPDMRLFSTEDPRGFLATYPDKTIIDEVWSAYPFMTETKVRNALAAFLFKGEEVYRKLDVCSGGERARVALLKLMLGGYNFLTLVGAAQLLDPYPITIHLDLQKALGVTIVLGVHRDKSGERHLEYLG